MEESFPGGIEIIRGCFIKRGVPEEAMSILIKSLSSSTQKQYAVTYKKWWSYCKLKNLDLYKVDIGSTISFLTDLFHSGASYATLNAHRSALSLILDISNSDEVIIKRFLKGTFKIKPSFPKYASTWDPVNVLNNIKNWYPLSGISLENLTKKLVVLLVLATGQRVQTISKISLDNIKQDEDCVKIFITDILKTSSYNREQPVLKFRFFNEQPELCVARTLAGYIEITKSIRKDEKYLILTFKKPHRKATTQSISRWIKDVLRDSGVDTDKFKSHSTRHASTSAAYRLGASIDQIRNTVGWTRNSKVFSEFYNRPLENELNFVELIAQVDK